MQVTRRDFLRYCGLSAAALGLSASELGRLAHALTAPGAPTVVWFHGSVARAIPFRSSTASPLRVRELPWMMFSSTPSTC